MAQIDKLLARLKNNPRGARFGDLVRLLRSVGWAEVGGAGSHRRFEPADGARFIIVVRPHGGEGFCRPAAVRGVLALVESERERP